MVPIIGIDIGTTLIKCSVIFPNGNIIDLQRNTPSINLLMPNNNEITFSPNKIWEIVRVLLREIIYVNSLDNVVISIVSQAPSVCLWDSDGNEIGVSYLAFYGNPQDNNYAQRRFKAECRLNLAQHLFSSKKSGYISCITGYIVYQLTGKLTIDAITAWELGIESELDEININTGNHKFAKIYSPTKMFPLLSKDFMGVTGNVLVGTSDSAVLPLCALPSFYDYYVYLGTWGSLLCSKIQNFANYKLNYHTGQLHDWLISIPNFINKCQNSIDMLESLFLNVYEKTENNCSISVCGGLTKMYTSYIIKFAEKYWVNRYYTVSPIENSAIGACKLGAIAIDEECV